MARPSDARIALLTAVGELHDEWAAANLDGPFAPRGKKSDYNLHYVDVDGDPSALDDFHAQAAELLAGADSSSSASEAADRNHWKQYWVYGEGRAKWSTWTELYEHLVKHMDPLRAKLAASAWFKERFGYASGSDKNRVAHGKPPRGNRIGPG